MSYREENGQVVLTMSREDYESLMMRIGSALIFVYNDPARLDRDLALVNRLNEGNPNYNPYQLSTPSPSSAPNAKGKT